MIRSCLCIAPNRPKQSLGRKHARESARRLRGLRIGTVDTHAKSVSLLA